MTNQCARMAVFLASDAEAQREIWRHLIWARSLLVAEPGYTHSVVLADDSDLMVVFLTFWKHRESAVRFDASGTNGVLTANIQRHIIGLPVVKLLRVY